MVEMAGWLPSMAYVLGKTPDLCDVNTVKRTSLYKPNTTAHSMAPMAWISL